jgi:transcription elongation factor Elf1
MKEFLRKCPSCGHRFGIRLESKKLVDRESDTERIVHNVVVRAAYGRDFRIIPAGVTYDEDIPIERERFDVTFECHHCHHTWTETVTKVQRE